MSNTHIAAVNELAVYVEARSNVTNVERNWEYVEEVLWGDEDPSDQIPHGLKLFELDTSVREAARQLDLAYNTVYSLNTMIRRAILITDTESFSLSGEIEMDESYFSGKRKGKSSGLRYPGTGRKSPCRSGLGCSG